MSPTHRYRATGLVYLLTFLVFLAGAIVAVLISRGYTIDPKSGSVSKTGLLVLNSTPGGAFVTIDNKVQSERTSARVKLAPGEYAVKVDKPGVVPWEKRLGVSPGEAVLEENILLFARQPARRVLAGSGVTAHALSPNGRWLGFVERTTQGATVSVAETVGDAPPVRFADLPAEAVTPLNLSVSNDGTRVTLGGSAQSFVLTRNDTPQPQPGGRLAFVPNRPGILITEQAGQLASIDLAAGTRQTLDGQVVSWTVTDRGLFSVSSDGALVRRDIRNGQREVIPTDRQLGEVSSVAGGAVFVRDRDNRLALLDGARLVPIADAVDLFASNAGGTAVAFVSNRELHLWRRDDGRRLVTRFSENPERVAVLTDGHYALYARAGELHGVAADGSNDHGFGSAGVAALELADAFTLVQRTADGQLSLVRLLER